MVPLDIRRKLGLAAGDQLNCEIRENALVLVPAREATAMVKKADDGLLVLRAPEGAPAMTPEFVNSLLHD